MKIFSITYRLYSVACGFDFNLIVYHSSKPFWLQTLFIFVLGAPFVKCLCVWVTIIILFDIHRIATDLHVYIHCTHEVPYITFTCSHHGIAHVYTMNTYWNIPDYIWYLYLFDSGKNIVTVSRLFLNFSFDWYAYVRTLHSIWRPANSIHFYFTSLKMWKDFAIAKKNERCMFILYWFW